MVFDRFQRTKKHPRDVMEVLVPPLVLLLMGRQMGVHETHGRVVNVKPDSYSALITLSKKINDQLRYSPCKSLLKTCLMH